jgi:hypothetical protein
MLRRLFALIVLPFLPGCVVVQHRHSLIDLGRFAGPLSDSDLTGRLLLIAACFGLVGGVVAWIVARSFTAWRAKRKQPRVSAP